MSGVGEEVKGGGGRYFTQRAHIKAHENKQKNKWQVMGWGKTVKLLLLLKKTNKKTLHLDF